MKHFIAMAGMRGCLPNYIAVHDDYDAAVTDLAELHDMAGSDLDDDLQNHGCVDLDVVIFGNEYAEVVYCNCLHPENHKDY